MIKQLWMLRVFQYLLPDNDKRMYDFLKDHLAEASADYHFYSVNITFHPTAEIKTGKDGASVDKVRTSAEADIRRRKTVTDATTGGGAFRLTFSEHLAGNVTVIKQSDYLSLDNVSSVLMG